VKGVALYVFLTAALLAEAGAAAAQDSAAGKAAFGSFGGRPSSYYDFYRIQNGKIAEHWDTIEPIPPRDEWKNSNGKF